MGQSASRGLNGSRPAGRHRDRTGSTEVARHGRQQHADVRSLRARSLPAGQGSGHSGGRSPWQSPRSPSAYSPSPHGAYADYHDDPSYLKAKAHFGEALDHSTWLRLQRKPSKGQHVQRDAEGVSHGSPSRGGRGDATRLQATAPQPIRVAGAPVTHPGWGAITDKDGEASSLAASMGSSVGSGVCSFEGEAGDKFDNGAGAEAPASAGMSAAGFEARSAASLASAGGFPAVHSLTAGTLSRQSTGSRDTLISYDTTSTGSGRWSSATSMSSRGAPPITATLVAPARLTTVPSSGSGSGSEGSSPTEHESGFGENDDTVTTAHDTEATPGTDGAADKPAKRGPVVLHDAGRRSTSSSPGLLPASRGRRSPARLPSVRTPAAVRARRDLAALTGPDVSRLGRRLRGLDSPLGTLDDTRVRSASDSAVRRVRRSSFRSRGGSANARSAAAAAAAVAAVNAKRRAREQLGGTVAGTDATRHRATPPPPVPRLRMVEYNTSSADAAGSPGERGSPVGAGNGNRYPALQASRRGELPAVELANFDVPVSSSPSALVGGYASGSATVTAAGTTRRGRGRSSRASRTGRSHSDAGDQGLTSLAPTMSTGPVRATVLPGLGLPPPPAATAASPAPSLRLLSSTPPPRRLAAMPRPHPEAQPRPTLSRPSLMGRHVPSPPAPALHGRRSPRASLRHSCESGSSVNAEALTDGSRSPMYESQLRAAAWWEPSGRIAVSDSPTALRSDSDGAGAGTDAQDGGARGSPES